MTWVGDKPVPRVTISEERLASNRILLEWGPRVTGAVLSVGSGGDIDKQGRYYRGYFSAASSYVTSDVNELYESDMVLDIRRVPLSMTETFDAVFCSGVLEHVDEVYEAVEGIYRILKPGGALLVGVPFKQPMHRAPNDFWRFTEYGIRYLLRDFKIEDFRTVGDDPAFPIAYWLFARKGIAS